MKETIIPVWLCFAMSAIPLFQHSASFNALVHYWIPWDSGIANAI